MLLLSAIRSNPGPRSLVESSSILPSRSISGSQVMLFQTDGAILRAGNQPLSVI